MLQLFGQTVDHQENRRKKRIFILTQQSLCRLQEREREGGRGVGRWGRTQFSQITNCFVCIFFILELILLAFIFTE